MYSVAQCNIFYLKKFYPKKLVKLVSLMLALVRATVYCCQWSGFKQGKMCCLPLEVQESCSILGLREHFKKPASFQFSVLSQLGCWPLLLHLFMSWSHFWFNSVLGVQILSLIPSMTPFLSSNNYRGTQHCKDRMKRCNVQTTQFLPWLHLT